MIEEEVVRYLKSLDSKLYKHASNILTKIHNWGKLKPNQKQALPVIIKEYLKFFKKNVALKGFSNDVISKRVKLLNGYYDFIGENNYDNVFTSQGKFRPTIIEEFMYILFKDFIETPQIGINQKDQDFAIYRPINITIGNSNVINTNLPIIAIENKTYICRCVD